MQETAARDHRDKEGLQRQLASLQTELREQQSAAHQREESMRAAAQEAATAAQERLIAAESQRDEARRVLNDISRQLSDARDAVKVRLSESGLAQSSTLCMSHCCVVLKLAHHACISVFYCNSQGGLPAHPSL